MSKKMGRKELGDNHSSTSVSSRPSPGETTMNVRTNGNKTPHWFSLRRVFRDIPGQRLMSSRKKKNNSLELEAQHVVGKASPPKLERSSTVQENAQTKKSGESLRTSLPIFSSEISTTTLSNTVECPLCALIQPKSNFPDLLATGCGHRSCKECLKQYLRIEITESRVNIACPECAEPLHPNDIRQILEEELKLYGKYEEFMLRRVLVSDPDARWCPAPDCNFVVVATGCASCPKLTCNRPGCGVTFCYHCKQYWHPNQTCDAAKAERSSNLRSSSFSQESSLHNEIKPCPRCQAFIIKMDDGSCNHMTCAICGAEFCWLCMKEISDLHYLSPSGCTFWGKKPWSRKKKILWQLGTLIGAPVGITLIAGIAVPAIMIGVPIWVGKRIYSKCSYMTVHKRNLATMGGVLSSILISPLLAAVTVGIGVPILLAYVYGVVPISLCRSGGCGVRTTNSGGVKIDFNEAETQTGNESNNYNATFAETRSVVEGTHGVTNPSIGPSIGEMSLVMTNSLSASGSHLDRVGAIREDSCDRDSASHRAMAGSCIAESLSGSLLGGNGGFQNRLEVQAEMTTASIRQDKRLSLSSESANLSIDTKSVTVSFGDSVSVKVTEGTADVLRSVSLKEAACLPATSSEVQPARVSSRGDLNGGGLCRVTSSTGEGCTAPSNDSSCMDVNGGHASALRSSFQRYGSPPTSRSVSFKAADTCGSVASVSVPSKESHHVHHHLHHNHHHHHHGAQESGKYRHYSKKQSMSVGDSIDEERIEPTNISTLDYLSVHSLAARQASTDPRILQQAPLECCPGGSDIVAMVAAEQLASGTSGSPKLYHQHHFSACQNLDARGSIDDDCRRFCASSARISSSAHDATSSCDTISSCNTMSTPDSSRDTNVQTPHARVVNGYSKVNIDGSASCESTSVIIDSCCYEDETNRVIVGTSPGPSSYHQHHPRDNLKISKYPSSHLAVMIETDGTDDDENVPMKCPSLVDSSSDRSGGSCTSISLFAHQ